MKDSLPVLTLVGPVSLGRGSNSSSCCCPTIQRAYSYNQLQDGHKKPSCVSHVASVRCGRYGVSVDKSTFETRPQRETSKCFACLRETTGRENINMISEVSSSYE